MLTPNNYLEVGYSGYSGNDDWLSATRSEADPFTDYSPPGGGPGVSSGNILYPYLFELERDQVDVKLSTHAESFIKGDHDFKFGVSYGTGDGNTRVGAGPRGVYYYRYEYTYTYYGYEYSYPYYYRVTARPYFYGADSENIAAFVDDSWKITGNVTLNLGVRFDRTTSDIPDYPVLGPELEPDLRDHPGAAGRRRLVALVAPRRTRLADQRRRRAARLLRQVLRRQRHRQLVRAAARRAELSVRVLGRTERAVDTVLPLRAEGHHRRSEPEAAGNGSAHPGLRAPGGAQHGQSASRASTRT